MRLNRIKSKVLTWCKSALSRLKPRPRTVRVQILVRDPLRVSLEDWRTDQELCRLGAKTLSDPAVRQMLDVLRFSHICRFTLKGGGTIEQKASHLSMCEGYSSALNDLESLGVFAAEPEPLRATFEPQEVENAT